MMHLVLWLAWLATSARGFGPGFTANVTRTLDDLLAGGRYDKRIRPNMGGPPIVVSVNMHIKSFGPISETAQMYTMDVYFRQIWHDARLRFSLPGLDEFSMSWIFLDKVWKPDTYFMNGKTSHLHRITSPNKFLRIRQDGYLVYSMRLTISARCKMHLKKFPMDTQHCPLVIGSYGYSSDELMYQWAPGVTVEPGLELSQYDLANISIIGHQKTKRNVGEFSMITANFLLRRNLGYYVLQLYVPCCLIVFCSFVSFWINPDDVPGRITLAATTVLSITTLGFVGRAALPKVNYATALDWFVILCFGTVFAVLVEYAAINFIDKVRVDIQRLLEERRKLKEEIVQEQQHQEEEIEVVDDFTDDELDGPPGVPRILMTFEVASEVEAEGVEEEKNEGEAMAMGMGMGMLSLPTTMKVTRSYSVPTITKGEYRFDQPRLARDTTVDVSLDLDQSPPRRRLTLRQSLRMPVTLWRALRILPTEEEVEAESGPRDKFSRIDICSRLLFPTAYCLLIACYYMVYTYYVVDDKERSDDFK